MKKKNIYISDLNHKKFLIKDLKKFKQHINLFIVEDLQFMKKMDLYSKLMIILEKNKFI